MVVPTTGVAAEPAPSSPGGPIAVDLQAATAKFAPRLRADWNTGERHSYVIEFSATADLTAAANVENWTARGAAVADALRRTAQHSQAAVIADLRTRGAEFTSFWIDNTVHVTSGALPLARQLAADPAVREVREPATVHLPHPDTAPRRRMMPEEVEWGVADIRADQVWQQYGDRGEGIVVASIDSGVQFDHPALVASYRGNNGDGTFDHDYSWFDPSQVCGQPSVQPCDNVGHGSHTMGTMIGDGGQGNRIGVAPGATWIAAKGCEYDACSEFGLTAAAQWILEPTDLAGKNPDPGARPNIVNNSWSGPGGDHWYADFVDAWVASGIFPVFSNGNNGDACRTTGAPGEYPQAYSVGNYTADGTIAATSSRGPGSGGELKPNISAPGTRIRSSVPGDAYAVFSGTSMAAPHLAGTVALMWSAAPALAGDVDATRQLLDDTARDTADDQCGGTVDDNNVYGEGRLDAYAAVTASPRGATGTLQGTVTNTDNGRPVPRAQITLTGPSDRTVTTDDAGNYAITVVPGTYRLRLSGYGYIDRQIDAVDIPADAVTTRDLTLSPAPMIQLTGTVTDGSGQGWPLYARVRVAGTPVDIHTAPGTGRFTATVPAGHRYRIQVTGVYPGYSPAMPEVTVDGDTDLDITLDADPATCTAPGYRRGAGLHQHFDEAGHPAGWRVVDLADSGQTWTFDDPGGRGNLTGGTGGFAVVDSDAAGEDGLQDTALVSPVVDLTDAADPVVEFATDLNYYWGERADVDLSTDGGRTWQTVWSAFDDLRGPATVRVPVPGAAGHSQVQVRFHYLRAGHDWWWQVDDVFLGEKTCHATGGGLIFGQTTNSLTGTPLDGVRVLDTANPAAGTVSGPTPQDDARGDGFYWLYSATAGTHRLTATAEHFAAAHQRLRVRAGAAIRRDLTLDSGRLALSGDTVTATVRSGGATTQRLVLSNRGNSRAHFTVDELDGQDAETAGPVIGEAASHRGVDTPAVRVPAEVSPLPTGGSGTGAAPADVAGTAGAGAWRDLTPYPHRIKDSVAGVHAGKLYSFGGNVGGGDPLAEAFVLGPDGAGWRPIAAMPVARQKPAGAFIGGRFVVTGGWGAGEFAPVAATSVYDPDTDSWSGAAPNPTPLAASGTAVLGGQLYVVGGCDQECGRTDVLRYDPRQDTWTRLADYPQNTAWASCGGIGGKVYCAGGVGPETDSLSAYVYEPGTDTWSPIADMPIDLWAGAYSVSSGRLLIAGGAVDRSSMITNEAIAYDPDTDSWSRLPNARYPLYRSAGACGLYKVGGSDGTLRGDPAVEALAGHTDCAAAVDVPWLRLTGDHGRITPGTKRVLRLTLDSSRVPGPGTYTAVLRVEHDTPYPVSRVTVRMVVLP